MNELRWILIGFGIVLLAGIYLWGRRGSAAVPEETALRARSEPPLQSGGFADARREDFHREPAYEEAVEETEPEIGSDDETVDVDPVVAEDFERPTIERLREKARAEDHEITAVRPTAPKHEATQKIEAAPRFEAPPRYESVPKYEPRPAAVDIAEPVEPPARQSPPDFRRGRVEPTLGDLPTVELPAPRASSNAGAPTLSSSDTPPPKRIDRRKILSLRLTASPQRLEGARLQEVLQSELMEHGKYDVFHRLHSDGQSIFSVASMVEPGTFDLEKMTETLYPGITLFAQLPGPVPGMHALNELVACARRLQQTLGGVLQDDRGVPLTVHRIERMRQEVREFERPPGSGRSGQGET